MRDLADLFREQQTAGFPAFSGSHVGAFIPVSATFLNRLAAGALPPDAPVSDIQIEPDAGNVVRIKVRITRAPFLPPLTITLSIERQPAFPDSPVVVLRLASAVVGVLAGAASRVLGALPNWVRLERELLFVDIAELLRQRGAAEWLRYVHSIEVTTAPGAVLLSIRAAVGPDCDRQP